MDTPQPSPSHVARQILIAFLFTFMAARILVYLIMSRRMPDLYLHLGGTHVHHLNYGIFLMSAVGAILLLRPPTPEQRRTRLVLTTLYGVALGLTFDEFGMWIHLGGDYWQRASYDAVVVVGGLFALIAFAPRIRHWRRRGWSTVAAMTVVLAVFWLTFGQALRAESGRIGDHLRRLEAGGPQ